MLTYRSFFSRSRESSSSSRVCSSLAFTLFRWLILSSAACQETKGLFYLHMTLYDILYFFVLFTT